MPTLTSHRTLRFRPGAWRLFAVIAGGSLGGISYPTFNLWPAIFLSLALVFTAIHDVGFWRGFRLGFVAGFCFYLTGTYWLSLYLGPEPLIALSLLEASIYALGTGFSALIWTKFRNRFGQHIFLEALLLATLWQAREWLSTHAPYGGFPWMRVAQALAETSMNRWVYLVGISGFSFFGAFISALLALVFINRARLIAKPKGLLSIISCIALLWLAPMLINPPSGAESGTLRVAAVQGNAKAGLFAHAAWGDVLKRHLDQTQKLLAEPAAKSAQIVIWPENAADVSPLDYPQSAAQISNLVKSMKKPLLFGTTRTVGDKVYNSSVLWTPSSGPVAIYDKKRPVPFAEYVPNRPFWYSLAPSLIGLIQRGFSAGHRSGVFRLQDKKLGVLICFEIAIDEINRDLVSQGSEVIISQTNNADFGRSAETYQQASLAKLQAIATGRAVVNISTVGVSAIFLPDGRVAKQLPAFKAADLVATVPLRTSETPAQRLGISLEIAVNLISLLLCLLALPRKVFRSKGL